ncbi:MAG: 2-hydroxyacyl-CoA dehydratase [Gemmatimonadales bacterium]
MTDPAKTIEKGAPPPRLLELDDGLSVAETIDWCRDYVEDLEFPTVRRWREAGGKVLGHFQVYFPEELAHAAGMLPVKLRGAPVERREADSHFGSYLCSIIKSSLELGLTGTVELDMFVTHPICDAARNLAGIWSRNLPHPAQILYFPQKAADEAYVLVALAGLISREEHNELLASLIPRIRDRDAQPQDMMRVVFEGGFCEQPPIDLLTSITQFCYVVDDDLLIGLRWILDDVPTDGEPLQALADAYLNSSSYSPVQQDLHKPKERMLLQRIRESGAEAAIVSAAKMCEPGLDEQVAYSDALDEKEIPYFVTEFEEKLARYDHLKIQLETFVENILFE